MNTIVRRVALRLAATALLSFAAAGFALISHAGPAQAVPGRCVDFHDSGLGGGTLCTP